MTHRLALPYRFKWPRRFKYLAATLLCLLVAACNDRELYRGLNQRDANEMVAALKRVGIEAKREDIAAGSYRIMIKEPDFTRAVEALSTEGLPRESFRSLAELFPGEGLIVTPFEQRARMMFAVNQELSKTVSAIDGVMSARVQVAIPELDLRGQPLTKPTASVVIHHRAGVNAGELSPKVRSIVSNSVQGLNWRDVSVSLFAQNGKNGAPAPAAARAAEPVAADPVVPAASPASSPAPEAGFDWRAILRPLLWIGAAGLAAYGLFVLISQRRRRST